MSLTFEGLSEVSNHCRGFPLRSTDIEQLLRDFDSESLILRLGPSTLYELPNLGDAHFVFVGLNRLRDGENGHPARDMHFAQTKNEVPIFRHLERYGVVEVRDSTLAGTPMEDWTIVRGERYPETTIVAVRKPISGLIACFRSPRYYPIR
jgi:hypothetical protein